LVDALRAAVEEGNGEVRADQRMPAAVGRHPASAENGAS
jgi:hypothetical protein